MDLSVVVVTYRSGATLAGALAALRASTTGDVQLIGWVRDGEAFSGVERFIRTPAGVVTGRTAYSGAVGIPTGIGFNDTDILWIEDGGARARVFIRDGTVDDEGGSYIAYSDNGGDPAEVKGGAGSASTTVGSRVFLATRSDLDEGQILSSSGAFGGDGFLVILLVEAQVDPDSAQKYASGMATDGTSIFYATAGVGESPSGVFKIGAAGGTPQRLATLPSDGGGVAVAGNFVYVALPSDDTVARIAIP